MTDTPELILPMQPGVDHHDHVKDARQVVAENAGVTAINVTPPAEVAGNMINTAQASFMENVVGVQQSPDQTTQTLTPNSSATTSNIEETLNAFRPGEDVPTVRTVSSKEFVVLKRERDKQLKEAA